MAPTGLFSNSTIRQTDKCILLDVDAVTFQNNTKAKALLYFYSGMSCVEPPFPALVPGESVDTLLSTARSVRFEFP